MLFRSGQEVTFIVDAFPNRNFRGRVTQVRNSPKTTQNVVTYDTIIDVDNRDLRLRPGMTANVSIIVAKREGTLRLPNAALRLRVPDGFEVKRIAAAAPPPAAGGAKRSTRAGFVPSATMTSPRARHTSPVGSANSATNTDRATCRPSTSAASTRHSPWMPPDGPRGTSAHGLPVNGLKLSKCWPDADSVHWPSIYILYFTSADAAVSTRSSSLRIN